MWRRETALSARNPGKWVDKHTNTKTNMNRLKVRQSEQTGVTKKKEIIHET